MNRPAIPAAQLAVKIAKALAKAAANAPTPSLRARLLEISAEATATAKRAKLAAEWGADTDALARARKVSDLAKLAEREAREAGAL